MISVKQSFMAKATRGIRMKQEQVRLAVQQAEREAQEIRQDTARATLTR